MWKSLYDGFLQAVSTKWTLFIAQASEQDIALKVRNTFNNDIYPSVGVMLIAVTLFFCLLYYYGLNNLPGYYFKIKYWFLFMLISVLSIAFLTYFLSSNEVKMFSIVKPQKFITALVMVNMFYSIILFYILSICIKWITPAKTTPKFFPY